MMFLEVLNMDENDMKFDKQKIKWNLNLYIKIDDADFSIKDNEWFIDTEEFNKLATDVIDGKHKGTIDLVIGDEMEDTFEDFNVGDVVKLDYQGGIEVSINDKATSYNSLSPEIKSQIEDAIFNGELGGNFDNEEVKEFETEKKYLQDAIREMSLDDRLNFVNGLMNQKAPDSKQRVKEEELDI